MRLLGLNQLPGFSRLWECKVLQVELAEKLAAMTALEGFAAHADDFRLKDLRMPLVVCGIAHGLGLLVLFIQMLLVSCCLATFAAF